MNSDDILALFKEILSRHGKPTDFAEDAELTAVGFRSLDFSELALRVELGAGVTLTFDATPLRAIRTVKDVLDFLVAACGKH
jgi:acyl carrier protein